MSPRSKVISPFKVSVPVLPEAGRFVMPRNSFLRRNLQSQLQVYWHVRLIILRTIFYFRQIELYRSSVLVVRCR